MENTLKTYRYASFTKAMEHSRTKILSLGYTVVNVKRKVKKRLHRMVRLLIAPNF